MYHSSVIKKKKFRLEGVRELLFGRHIQAQPLRSNERQFQGGLVFKARRLWYHSSVIKNKKKFRLEGVRELLFGRHIQAQLLRSNEKQFRGGLVFKACGLLYHSSLG